MIDYLKEILAHTHTLGFLELVKVEGTTDTTGFISVSTDRNIHLSSKFNTVLPEFTGVFGLHDLGKLNTIVNIPEYKENASITFTTQDGNPSGIVFQNSNKDFKNTYRFMGRELVEQSIQTRTRKTIPWDVTIEPTLGSIQRLKFQSQAAGSSITTFKAWTDNNALKFSLGDIATTNHGEFSFATNVSGKLTNVYEWPLQQIQSILNLVGDKTLRIFDGGLMEIVITTGLANHQFSIRAIVQ